MHGLFANFTDGMTYSSDVLLAVFEDADVADLVRGELANLTRVQRERRDLHGATFIVRPVLVVRAESEGRVRGLVQQILDQHFPRLA